MPIKYIYTEKGQQESIIIPIDFWNDIFNRFDLKNYLKKENYFISKYSELLMNLHISEKKKKKSEDIFSLFGSWQSEKSGEELNNEIYSSRNDSIANDLVVVTRNVKHFERLQNINVENWID